MTRFQATYTKCKAAMLNLLKIKAARKNITRTVCNKLVVALVLSHLDYANGILGGLPKSSIKCRQYKTWQPKSH